jgi:hypothetical protein
MPLKITYRNTGHSVTHRRGRRIYEGKSHQRVIAERMAAIEGRLQLTMPVAECSVRHITNARAKSLIVKHEYLGTMPSAPLYSVGLFSPEAELLGVAVFNKHTANPPTKKPKALCLARGACVYFAPENASSYLISNACKLLLKKFGIEAFYAYADADAGEQGFIYEKVLGWKRLPPSKSASRYLMVPPTKNACGFPDKPLTDRAYRRARDKVKCGHTYVQHYAMGWVKEPLPPKPRFVKRMT